MDIISIIIIITFIIIFYKYLEKKNYDVIMVKSNINNKEYLVRNVKDKQQAADLLAKLSIKLEKLINIIVKLGPSQIYDTYLSENNNSDIKDQIIKKLNDDIKRLNNNFNPNTLSETTPDAQYTSYSVNKGEKIVFCLRNKNINEELVKENIMTFVAIHELSHLMTKSIGHEPEFWNNFKLLLQIAIDYELYKNINFNNTPKEYCGINITDTPLKS